MKREGVLVCGVPSMAELLSCPGRPGEERMKRGPVAVIECVQEIPCNPCQAACPKKAITVGENITNCPRLDEQLCVGCGICISKCPGLAIFVVDRSLANGRASVEFPFEYAGLPAEGDVVDAVDRYGRAVCKGTVLRVNNPPANNHTAVVKLEIPDEYADVVRSMKRRGRL